MLSSEQLVPRLAVFDTLSDRGFTTCQVWSLLERAVFNNQTQDVSHYCFLSCGWGVFRRHLDGVVLWWWISQACRFARLTEMSHNDVCVVWIGKDEREGHWHSLKIISPSLLIILNDETPTMESWPPHVIIFILHEFDCHPQEVWDQSVIQQISKHNNKSHCNTVTVSLSQALSSEHPHCWPAIPPP